MSTNNERRPIQFDTTSKPSPTEAAPAPDAKKESTGATQGGGFRNLTYKGENWKLALKFSKPLTWLRFLPPISVTAYNWLLKLDVYKDKNGVTFVNPRTFNQGAKDPFQQAQFWLRKNRPEVLYSKDNNPNGLKLWTAEVGVAWVIEKDAEEGSRLRLFNSSLYDGKRGGTVGLAHTIFKLATEVDMEPGSPTLGEKIYGEITGAETGRLVKIERTKTDKAEYPSYAASIGRSAAPLQEYLDTLTEEEYNLIVPLETLINVPTEAEIKEILRSYINSQVTDGEALFHQIFA